MAPDHGSRRSLAGIPGLVARVRGFQDAAGAGHGEPIAFEARLSAAGEGLVVDAQVQVDRTAFGMTWSPLHMASRSALLIVRTQVSKSSAA